MTGRPSPTYKLRSHYLPTGQAAFLIARLSEEIDAALARPLDTPRLTMLVELRNTLKFDQKPDQFSIDILTVVYARHPDFCADWNKRCSA